MTNLPILVTLFTGGIKRVLHRGDDSKHYQADGPPLHPRPHDTNPHRFRTRPILSYLLLYVFSAVSFAAHGYSIFCFRRTTGHNGYDVR
jgi:hypothetical protein